MTKRFQFVASTFSDVCSFEWKTLARAGRVEDAGQGGSLDFEEVSSQFDEVSRFTTSELDYVFQVERHEGRVAGHDDAVVTALRATLVFRREDGVWKIAHRHAAPIMSTRPATTLLQS